jgi:hypothetical protein
MKDCIFQYATGNGNIKQDTDLITRAMAEQLWQTYIGEFMNDLGSGKEPEMAIWINMITDSDFKITGSHWCSSEMFLENDNLYVKEQVG